MLTFGIRKSNTKVVLSSWYIWCCSYESYEFILKKHAPNYNWPFAIRQIYSTIFQVQIKTSVEHSLHKIVNDYNRNDNRKHQQEGHQSATISIISEDISVRNYQHHQRGHISPQPTASLARTYQSATNSIISEDISVRNQQRDHYSALISQRTSATSKTSFLLYKVFNCCKTSNTSAKNHPSTTSQRQLTSISPF
jgi:hypothetical protein